MDGRQPAAEARERKGPWLGLAAAAVFLGLIAYAVFFYKVQVYKSDGTAVSREVAGGALVWETVHQTIRLDKESGRFRETTSGPVDCPT